MLQDCITRLEFSVNNQQQQTGFHMLNIARCMLKVFAHVSLQKCKGKFIFGTDINDTS